METDEGYGKVEERKEEKLMILFELLIKMLELIVMLIFLLGLLFILLISVVYIAGYLYDSVIGNLFIRVGHFVGGKYPKIRKFSYIIKLWNKIQIKDLYLRYETPLVTYCLSYTAISLIVLILPYKNIMSFFVASAVYLLLYFIGMYRKCGYNEQYYEKILDNNMDFLKLSFLPLGFLITVIGFGFTITGMKLQEIPFDFAIVENMLNTLMNYNDETNTVLLFVKIVGMAMVILLLFYIISLPMQVLSYYIISVIRYLRKHKKGYIELFKKFRDIVVGLLGHIW